MQEQRIWVGPSRITTNDAAILEYDLVGAVVAGFEEEELIFVGGIEGPSCVFHDGEVHGFDARGRGIGSAIGPLLCLAFYDYVWTGSPFVLSPLLFIISLIIYYVNYTEPLEK